MNVFKDANKECKQRRRVMQRSGWMTQASGEKLEKPICSVGHGDHVGNTSSEPLLQETAEL